MKKDKFSWEELVTGFNEKKIESFNKNHNEIYEMDDLYRVKEETEKEKLLNARKEALGDVFKYYPLWSTW